MNIPSTTCFAHSSCTSLFILIFIKSTVDCIAHFILFHCTFYSLFYFFNFFFFHIFLSYSYLYLYIFSYVSFFILFFCTVHWADLSWPTFHYWLYPVWLCMWRIIKNLEPSLSVCLDRLSVLTVNVFTHPINCDCSHYISVRCPFPV